MTILAVLPFLGTALTAALAPRLARSAPPAVAVPLLSLLAIVCALSAGFALSVLAFDIAAPALAAVGRWSLPVLTDEDPIPPVYAVIPAAAALVLLLTATGTGVRQVRDLVTAEQACRRLRRDAGGLVIIRDDEPRAFTVGALSSRVVVSSGMLRLLPTDERAVMLAHEDSHRRHAHHACIRLCIVAAAANPLLRSLLAAVRLAVERWADEDAVRDTGDRIVAARAIARAALASRPSEGTDPATLHGAQSAVAERVRALTSPPPSHRAAATAALTLLLALTVSGGIGTERVTERRFELARDAYDAHGPACDGSVTSADRRRPRDTADPPARHTGVGLLG